MNTAGTIRFTAAASLFRAVLVSAIVAFASSAVSHAQDAKTAPKDGPIAATLERFAESSGEQLIDQLQSAWPDPPESVAMLLDILKGSQLGPGEGWFKKAVVQSRYGWAATRKRFDRDGDGRISRDEFGGSDADFTRLDRDHDGALSEPDFDFSAHALSPSPGAMLFYRVDRDGDGKLTRDELERFFRAVDTGGEGFLSLADLQEAFSPLARPGGSSRNSQGPTRLTLIKGLFRQEIGSLQAGPALDSAAPISRSRRSTARKKSRSRRSWVPSRSSWFSATSRVGHSVARPAMSKSSTSGIATAPRL